MESNLFKTKKKATQQKLRGGYYTPTILADYISKWVLDKNTKTILEPSFGDGNFITSLVSNVDNNIKIEITGVEINSEEFYKGINKVKNSYSDNISINWLNNDFFKAYDFLNH